MLFAISKRTNGFLCYITRKSRDKWLLTLLQQFVVTKISISAICFSFFSSYHLMVTQMASVFQMWYSCSIQEQGDKQGTSSSWGCVFFRKEMLSQQISTYIWLPQNLHLAICGYKRSWEVKCSIPQPLQKSRQSRRMLRWRWVNLQYLPETLKAWRMVSDPLSWPVTLPISDTQNKGGDRHSYCSAIFPVLLPFRSHWETYFSTTWGQIQPGNML